MVTKGLGEDSNEQTVTMITDQNYWLARFLAPIAGVFRPVFPLARSVGLSFLTNSSVVGIKFLVVIKNF